VFGDSVRRALLLRRELGGFESKIVTILTLNKGRKESDTLTLNKPPFLLPFLLLSHFFLSLLLLDGALEGAAAAPAPVAAARAAARG
jgi:hypothetical protein